MSPAFGSTNSSMGGLNGHILGSHAPEGDGGLAGFTEGRSRLDFDSSRPFHLGNLLCANPGPSAAQFGPRGAAGCDYYQSADRFIGCS